MGPKQYIEKIIVTTSHYLRTDLTRKFLLSLKQDNVPFTSLVAFDGTPEEQTFESLIDVDIALYFKKPIHSLPEIMNQLFNFSKFSDAKFVMFCDNDIEFKKGSFKRMSELIEQYDVVSPIKIDGDYGKFLDYSSNEDLINVIGSNDSVWFFRLDKLSINPIERNGPFNFEDVPLNYNLWMNKAKFVVDPQSVVFHHGSQETGNCFTPEDRKIYSDEWDAKRDLFLKSRGSDAQWFFNNVVMNQEGVKRFGYPVYIIK